MQLEVVEAFHFAGTDYAVGQLIDTDTLPPRSVRQLLGRFPVAVAGGGGGGTGGPETDPVAAAAMTAHKGSADHDTHNDARLAPKVHGHPGVYEPAGAVATHAGAADPHGDRAYSDGRIAALVNAAPAALDTLAEIDAQMQSDETGAAAMQASINTKASQTALDTHVNKVSGAHAATAVSVSPAGLAVVTGTDVQAAIAQLDAMAGHPTAAAGGALSGNYPSPDITAGYLTDAHVSPGAAIAESKLALASDVAPAVASRRVSRWRTPVGNWKLDMYGGVPVATAVMANNFAYPVPFFVAEPESWDQVAIRAGSTVLAGGAGVVIDFAIYGDTGEAMISGAPLATVMGVAFPAAANGLAIGNLAAPLAVTPGVYHIAAGYRYTTAPTTAPTVWGVTGYFGAGSHVTSMLNSSAPWFYWNYAGAFGANPAVSANGNSRPLIGVHVASRP